MWAIEALRDSLGRYDPSNATARLDEATGLETRQRTSERVARDAEALSELTLGRQPLTGRQPPGRDVGLQPP